MGGPGHTSIMFPFLETDVAGEVLALVLISWVTLAAASVFMCKMGVPFPFLQGSWENLVTQSPAGDFLSESSHLLP